MFDEYVSILENKKVNSEYYKLVFTSDRLSRKVQPGQFMNLQIENPQGGLLLRRPFSYYRINGKKLEILYEILGRGTGVLAQKRKGQQLRVLGPLGRAFAQKIPGKKRVLVAGGVGVPPLVFLAETVKDKRDDQLLLIGCKTKHEVLPKKELAKIKGHVMYATNDGSYGQKGEWEKFLLPPFLLMRNNFVYNKSRANDF